MTQPQEPLKNKPLKKRQFSILKFALISIANFFILQLLLSQFSTFSIILIGALAVLLSSLLVLAIKRPHRTKLFTLIAIGLTISIMVFSVVGFYLSRYYGPTVPQVGFPQILETSLSSHLQLLEQSASFQFIEAQHFGTVRFESLSIHSSYSNAPEGGVNWDFYGGDVVRRLMVGQTSGKSYYFSSIDYGKGHPIADTYLSNKSK
jgi:hypothetical protein